MERPPVPLVFSADFFPTPWRLDSHRATRARASASQKGQCVKASTVGGVSNTWLDAPRHCQEKYITIVDTTCWIACRRISRAKAHRQCQHIRLLGAGRGQRVRQLPEPLETDCRGFPTIRRDATRPAS